MVSPGDSFRAAWTADFHNRLEALLKAFARITGSNGINVTPGKNGIEIAGPILRNPLSTIQGTLTGGDPVGVSDGTVILDLSAFDPYSIFGAAFILAAGTTTLSVLVNSTPVSWLNALSITTSMTRVSIPNPVTDLTHVVARNSTLSILLASTSADATGLDFSLNVPY